ncbi:MAG: hypothetical protein DI555_19860 [Novosphingobium pentaromativorans]|uniref:Uncharacterized protein n=1 Tax=Novosphingobium pentaromativorans TaxID=205844 RepID=A0A2W5Q3Q9_9SPHN|nr:hypothetical protein [Novosphingobium panipatense]PZQ51947.1 MAG: hypothetical protein DI555_19860 [Novosphingobium pentaromativorans]
MDIEGEDISGEDILPLLHRPDGQRLADSLIGAGFYMDDPETIATIIAFDPRSRAVRVETPGGQSRNLPFASGYVLLTPALVSAIAFLRTPADEERDRMRRKIAAFGFRSKIEDDELPGLLAAVEAAHAYRLPWREERFEGLRLVRKYGSAREEAKLLTAWLEGADDPPPGDMVIALVSALRETGHPIEALARTDLVTRKANGLDRKETCILLTQRGALWLDRYELEHDPEFLDRARQCAKRSWAIEPGEECSMLYNRIRKLEG